MAVGELLLGLGATLLITTVGAFIANYAWDQYQAPELEITAIESNEVIKQKEETTHHRLKLADIGRSPAEGCKANLFLLGKNRNTERYIFSDVPLGWIQNNTGFVNTRDELSESVVIGEKESAACELCRSKNAKAGLLLYIHNRVRPGGRPIAQIDATRVDEKQLQGGLDGALLHDAGITTGEPDPRYEQSNVIPVDMLLKTDWIIKRVRITSDNAPSVVQEIEFEKGQDGLEMQLI